MESSITFHDYHPDCVTLEEAIIAGLSKEQKSIPPKFFYNERGSQLFDKICDQPEYYPPTVEREMLKKRADEIATLTGSHRVLIEPGAGSAEKVRLLLDTLRPAAFIPMDISFDYLKTSASDLSAQYPWLDIHATCVDFSHSLPIPEIAPEGPRLFFFPGSSIGNFDHDEAEAFLRMAHDAIGNDGMLLIGVDTKKNEAQLNAAYNDQAGVTAQFNLNLLHRMRDELNIDCNPDHFDHKAFYNGERGRIEMHLVSNREQTLKLNGYRFEFEKGESVHTENSYKYAPDEFLRLAEKSGFRAVRHWLAPDNLFAIYLLEAA